MEQNKISTDAALELLAETINESIDDVQMGVSLTSLEGWDSMAVLLLMAEFDERFSIILDEDKINSLKLVDDIITVLSENNFISES